ncbi:unnamed protein product [Rhizoctonia solani]|uniref:DUF6533 domain-containing protein n=1 Tax=Rhizoctonia solani TaxID=456999 RepID=A0A8H3AG10_9AGAM|nr:unnamed protein product [Rhizoctonia solani]
MPLLIYPDFNNSLTAAAVSTSQYKPFLDLFNIVQAQGETARYLAFSGITLLLYDWLTTLDKEIEYAWNKKWTFAGVVYYLNRVLPVLLIGTILLPNVLFLPAHFGPSTLVQEGYFIIQLRCHSFVSHYLHHFNHTLLGVVLSKMDPMVWLLIPGLLVTIGHATLQVTVNLKRMTVMTNPFPQFLRGCIVSIPNDIWLAYFSGVLYDLVIFCLIVWRIQYLGHGLGLSPLMTQLLKHGASFFAVNLALMLFSCVGSAYPSTIIMANASGLLTALSSITCSRIFFSMHEFARQDRVRISFGQSPITGVHGSNIISGQFAIPMETFSDCSRSPSNPEATSATTP